jgi:hypothetical protein
LRTQKAESLLAEAFTLCTPGRPFLGEQVGALLQIVLDSVHCFERTLSTFRLIFRIAALAYLGQSFHPDRLPMKHFQFKWVLRDQQYQFSGLAQTSRAQQPEVDAELVEIWAWLQRQKLRPGKFGWEATRMSVTSKVETLSVSHGAVQSDGETIFSPLETRLVLTLPDTAAVNFRFEFNVVDDRT